MKGTLGNIQSNSISVLQMWKLRPQADKQLTQGHTLRWWREQEHNVLIAGALFFPFLRLPQQSESELNLRCDNTRHAKAKSVHGCLSSNLSKMGEFV